MNPTSKVKSIISLLVASQRFKFNAKIKLIQHKVVIDYLIPYLNGYVREVIIAKGLDPDKVPAKKKTTEDHVKNTVNFVSSITNLLEKNGINNTRGKSLALHLVPKWVRESFRDSSKHPLYKKPMAKKVVEELTVPLPSPPVKKPVEEAEHRISEPQPPLMYEYLLKHVHK